MPSSVSRRSIQAGLLALVFVSAPAWAQTRVTEVRVHGTSCTLQHGSAGQPEWGFVGLMNNDRQGTDGMAIICPVPRSTYRNTTIGGTCNGTGIRPSIDVIDGNPASDVLCNLLIFNEANAVTSLVFARSAGFTTTGVPQRVEFPLPAAITVNVGDRLGVECTIPSGSSSGAQPSGIVGITFPVCDTTP
jgi:hypothetical protein